MAQIKSGATEDILTVDTVSAAARVLQVDAGGNSQVTVNSFLVTGTCAAAGAVAASLAANTNLMALRNGGTKKMYITSLEWLLTPVTLPALNVIPIQNPGAVVWQRFSAQTPTGGTARTVAPKIVGGTSTVVDVRDSNAALTGSAPTWGGVIAARMFAPMVTVFNAPPFRIDFKDNPLVIPVNEGIGIRTGAYVMPGTLTWVYSYTIEWYEV